MVRGLWQSKNEWEKVLIAFVEETNYVANTGNAKKAVKLFGVNVIQVYIGHLSSNVETFLSFILLNI